MTGMRVQGQSRRCLGYAHGPKQDPNTTPKKDEKSGDTSVRTVGCGVDIVGSASRTLTTMKGRAAMSTYHIVLALALLLALGAEPLFMTIPVQMFNTTGTISLEEGAVDSVSGLSEQLGRFCDDFLVHHRERQSCRARTINHLSVICDDDENRDAFPRICGTSRCVRAPSD